MLITGESGTGKELVARALHRHSPRAAGPFVAINTAAIPKDLLESELFGHERGAFTGAQTTRRGRFEQAEGGTLFLDEIGDMPPDLQVRLLRVLADGEYYRVGGHSPQARNGAHHRGDASEPRGARAQGLFREDLLHRLNVVRLRLPPLRERARGHRAAGAPFPAEERARARRRSQDADRRRAAALAGFAFPGQRAPAREHLSLADGDGARTADRRRRPAAGRARCAARTAIVPSARLGAGARSRARAGACERRARTSATGCMREFERTLIGARSRTPAVIGWKRPRVSAGGATR